MDVYVYAFSLTSMAISQNSGLLHVFLFVHEVDFLVHEV